MAAGGRVGSDVVCQMGRVMTETLTAKWTKLYASLYFFLGKAMVDRFDCAGERALRETIRAYGAYRASRMRADHEAAALNELELAQGAEDRGPMSTSRAGFPTLAGQALYDAWREMKEGGELPIGSIYLETVSRATRKSPYNSSGKA